MSRRAFSKRGATPEEIRKTQSIFRAASIRPELDANRWHEQQEYQNVKEQKSHKHSEELSSLETCTGLDIRCCRRSYGCFKDPYILFACNLLLDWPLHDTQKSNHYVYLLRPITCMSHSRLFVPQPAHVPNRCTQTIWPRSVGPTGRIRSTRQSAGPIRKHPRRERRWRLSAPGYEALRNIYKGPKDGDPLQ